MIMESHPKGWLFRSCSTSVQGLEMFQKQHWKPKTFKNKTNHLPSAQPFPQNDRKNQQLTNYIVEGRAKALF